MPKKNKTKVKKTKVSKKNQKSLNNNKSLNNKNNNNNNFTSKKDCNELEAWHFPWNYKKYKSRCNDKGCVWTGSVMGSYCNDKKTATNNKLKYIGLEDPIYLASLDREELFPIFKKCEELEMSIFVHPWDMMGKEKMEKYWLPWLVGMPAETSLAICSMIFGGVFERLPKLKVAFAHGGGSFPATIGRMEHGFNVRPDLCAIDNNVNPRDYLGNFYLDSLVHEQKMLDLIVEMMGENKICLGT